MIPASGLTYKNLPGSPFIPQINGQSVMQGETFVCPANLQGDALLAKMICLGYVVEVYAGSDYATQSARRDALLVELAQYLEGHSGGDMSAQINALKGITLRELGNELLVEIAVVTTSPITAGATTVSGTATNGDGEVVTIFKNGASVGTATVSSGTWSKGSLAALVGTDTIDAKVFIGDVLAGTAARVTVRFGAPTVTGPISNNATVVSGTTSSTADGTTITVYKNGTSVGTTTVTSNAWSLSGISPALTTGQSVTAKASAADGTTALSAVSNTVVVS